MSVILYFNFSGNGMRRFKVSCPDHPKYTAKYPKEKHCITCEELYDYKIHSYEMWEGILKMP